MERSVPVIAARRPHACRTHPLAPTREVVLGGAEHAPGRFSIASLGLATLVLVVRNAEGREDQLPSVMLPLQVAPHPLVVVGREAGVAGDDARDLLDVVAPMVLFP